MTTNIRFATFNVGQGVNDWSMMVKADPEQKQRLEQLTDEIGTDPEKVEEYVNNLEVTAAERLADQADVISLQEVVKTNRAFMKTLEKDFDIYYFTSPVQKGDDSDRPRIGTALAFRKEMFTGIEDCSIKSESHPARCIYGQEISSFRAIEIKTNKVIQFSSLHSWGFQLYSETQQKRYDQKDLNQQEYALAYAKEAIQNADISSISIMGGDMNNNPHNYHPPFHEFKTSNYKVLNPDQPTNVNMFDEGYIQRKIDFIFAKGAGSKNFFHKIGRAFQRFFYLPKPQVSISKARVANGFEFTLAGNCSDHKPLIATIKIVSKSCLQRFGELFKKKKRVTLIHLEPPALPRAKPKSHFI